ncbi:peptidoglycan-binding protein LysM [Alphaproteobacteria bacterium]|nr:peptidoglycan-binding protein LysM [Alphaproteobacteria bacterium]
MKRAFLIVLFGVALLFAAVFVSMRSVEDAGAPPTPAQIAHPPPDETPKTQSQTNKPSFDIVRVNPQGEAVIAGRSAPLARIVILDGEQEIGRVVADDRGEWVFVPDHPLPAGPRQLSLKAENPDGTTINGDAPVLLAVPDRKDSSDPALAVRVGEDGALDVLQGPGAKSDAPIVVLGVRYDGQNALTAVGESAPFAEIRLYLDDGFLARTIADKDGKWRAHATPGLIAPGERRLRADLIGEKGKVEARVEMVFSLEGDDKGDKPAGSAAVVTVEKGDCLWRIARTVLGSGYDFVLIYEANQKQIRNPDLIYPGQVFIIPNNR